MECPIFNQESFGKNLRRARIRNNYTVKQIADYIAVTPQCVYDYENAKKLPSADRLLNLMVLYGVEAKELLDIAA